jgi:hypothetical protein
MLGLLEQAGCPVVADEVRQHHVSFYGHTTGQQPSQLPPAPVTKHRRCAMNMSLQYKGYK